MRSQVTRHVLRRLSTSRAPAAIHLPYSIPTRPLFRTYPVGCRFTRTPQRRTFLNLFQKPPRTLKELETEPGYETLLTYRAAENDNVRPPPTTELVKAWREFFGYKAQHKRVVNSTQAMCAYRVLEYLCRSEVVEGVQLSQDDLRVARDCLVKTPRDDNTHHLELSRSLYKEIRRRALGIQKRSWNDPKLEVDIMNPTTPGFAKDFHALLVALSQYGMALQAKDMLLETYRKANRGDVDSLRPRHTWLPVLSGLAKEGHETVLRETVSLAEEFGVDFDPAVHEVMTSFYAQRDKVMETKHWFQRRISKNHPPSANTYYAVLQFALRNNQREWAMDIYEKLVSGLESGSLRGYKFCWDVLFQWAVLLLDKGIDHIDHMFNIAYKNTKDKPTCQPNAGTMNVLIKSAITKDDPYLAERFITLSKKRGIEPNFKTFMLQLEYRIRANDLDGAFSAYQSLQNQDEPTKDQEMSILNEFIRNLCSATQPNYERVLDVTSYLEQRHVTLEPETVVSICMAFMKNDETYEVIDTLSLHTIHYSVAERYRVRKAFVEYCLDKKNSTARVWDAYALLRQFFPEVENEDRIAVMDAFFDRRRADMACHVFGHMRSHGSATHRPTLEVYVRCFEGIGRCPDLESLKMVHNMLKMDTNIQPNTLLFNSLMIAYTSCEVPHRAVDFWKEITSSPEGPSYTTLEIIFRAYEIEPFGDEPAQELWEKIRKMEIDVPEQVYASYAATMAAHGHLPEVKTILEGMEDVVGKRPTPQTLGYAFNALPSPEMQEEYHSWAEHEYPPTWKSLKEKYRGREEEGLMKYKIPRPWKA